MNIKASGRSALIIAAGVWLCFAGPVRAAENDARAPDSAASADNSEGDAPVALNKSAKHSSKKHAEEHSRKSGKAASKAANGKKTDDADAAPDDAAPSAMPPSVANASAQLQAADTAADAALKTISAQAENVLKAAKQSDSVAPQTDVSAANTQPTVSTDQLNEVDRSLSEDKATAAMTVAQAPQTPFVSNDDSTWNRTSLIGKVFIAFGGLLTLASAARMFMA
jgi:hypothetical protein